MLLLEFSLVLAFVFHIHGLYSSLSASAMSSSGEKRNTDEWEEAGMKALTEIVCMVEDRWRRDACNWHPTDGAR